MVGAVCQWVFAQPWPVTFLDAAERFISGYRMLRQLQRGRSFAYGLPW